jgi:hypothetical protein
MARSTGRASFPTKARSYKGAAHWPDRVSVPFTISESGSPSAASQLARPCASSQQRKYTKQSSEQPPLSW